MQFQVAVALDFLSEDAAYRAAERQARWQNDSGKYIDRIELELLKSSMVKDCGLDPAYHYTFQVTLTLNEEGDD